MAKYGSGSVTVTIDDSGGTPRIVTPYVNSINGLKIETITQEINPFGGTAEKPNSVGVYKSQTVTLTGFLDDTATVGVIAVFGTISSTVAAASRTIAVVTGGATFTVEAILTGFEIMPKNGGLTEYAATYQTVAVGALS